MQFYLWVRLYETGAASVWVSRPPGVEGWLPVASLMNLKCWLVTGEVPRIHPAGMFLLVDFLAISWLLRKAFCSWLCPVGTLSEWLWRAGRRMFGRNPRLPRWLDIGLRSLKYLLLALFVYAVGNMRVADLRAFLDGPYGVIADVKMLNFFRYLSLTSAVVIGLLVAASLLVQNFWCRYLCPYGALMGLFSMLSPLRIRRHPAACVDCGACARACPSLLPVDALLSVKSAECTGCLECIAACPSPAALCLAAPGRRPVARWVFAALLVALFVGIVGYAKFTNHWRTDLPSQVYSDLVPRAAEYTHP